MKKIKKRDNILIKHIILKKMLHNSGIKRINKNTLNYLEKVLQEDISNKINDLSRELIIKGKKTLEKKDIKDFFNKLKEEETWEI